MSTVLCLEQRHDDLARTRIDSRTATPLGEGEVRMRVDRFALTANNITYGVIGELLGYWDFFPADEQGWGRIPAMGWADLVESAHPEIEAGGRYYGWYPMATECTLIAAPTGAGLRDESPHRAGQAPVYRSFVATDRDPLYADGDDSEDRHALLRGLFATAFLADEYFAERGYLGAGTVVVLSASSKTAIGFAQRAATRGLERVVGLTSAANAAFVESLGYYDQVLTYDEVDLLPDGADAVSVDMAGNGPVLELVHRRLGERLKHSMVIGMSHHDAPREGVSSGPEPELFFAPAEIEKRTEQWGAKRYSEALAAALAEFVAGSERWLTIERSYGPDAAAQTYADVLAGKVPPSVGPIVSLHGR
jgi:Protein of unknown function (DUF2855)